MDAQLKDLSSLPGKDAAKTAFWKQHIDAWRDSNLTQRSYAAEHGLAIARFVYWKNKFYPNTSQAKKKRFVRARITTTQHSIRLIHPNGIVIECGVGTDVSWLRSLLGLSSAS
jgi:hypothetical protein